MKSFENLIKDSGLENPNEIKAVEIFKNTWGMLESGETGLEILSYDNGEPDEVIDAKIALRAEIFINVWELAEKSCRDRINDLSFQINKKSLEGCQVLELLQFYNEKVGEILDAFIC